MGSVQSQLREAILSSGIRCVQLIKASSLGAAIHNYSSEEVSMMTKV